MATNEELLKRITALEAKVDRQDDVILLLMDASAEMANALRQSNQEADVRHGAKAIEALRQALSILQQESQSHAG